MGGRTSLCALRKSAETGPDAELFNIFSVSGTSIITANWLPRSQKTADLITRLGVSDTPTVNDLFRVHQGVRTGDRPAFVLSASEFRSLPPGERDFFRPAAGTSTIREGRIVEEEYLFFPYAQDGKVAISALQDLKTLVPEYYASWLRPREDSLAARKGINPAQWWLLTRERQWQAGDTPKILSAAFGDKGSFGYDSEGRFVVVQGWAWFWIAGEGTRDETEADGGSDGDEGDEVDISFDTSGLPWAYAAMLNSSVFEILLAHFCPRVQGGQFHLDSHFIKNVFLPDLTDQHAGVGEDVRALEVAGRALSLGQAVDLRSIDKLTANMYGVPISEWDRAKKRG